MISVIIWQIAFDSPIPGRVFLIPDLQFAEILLALMLNGQVHSWSMKRCYFIYLVSCFFNFPKLVAVSGSRPLDDWWTSSCFFPSNIQAKFRKSIFNKIAVSLPDESPSLIKSEMWLILNGSGVWFEWSVWNIKSLAWIIINKKSC